MTKEFYSSALTQKSRNVLQKIAGEMQDFVLIGGWAVNFYVRVQKSTDIDLVIGADKLAYFKKYGIEKHKGLDMYFAVVDGVTVDLIVEGISKDILTIPIDKILSSYITVEGIRAAPKSILLLLKMCGYFSSDPSKIDKDIIDVVSLLFYSGVNLEEVNTLIKEYHIDERKGFSGMLEYLDKGQRLWHFITSSREEYDRLRADSKKAVGKYL
jgi:hypothetical protein